MNRIIDILKTLDRPGVDEIIRYMLNSNFATATGGGHHKYAGGLVDHSMEVYEIMMSKRGDIPIPTIIVCAFFHDLGKSKLQGFIFNGAHWVRSIKILDRCGFSLTDEERYAILNHHKLNIDYFTSRLRHCLSSADMNSTGQWKITHPTDNSMKNLKNHLLYLIGKF